MKGKENFVKYYHYYNDTVCSYSMWTCKKPSVTVEKQSNCPTAGVLNTYYTNSSKLYL